MLKEGDLYYNNKKGTLRVQIIKKNKDSEGKIKSFDVIIKVKKANNEVLYLFQCVDSGFFRGLFYEGKAKARIEHLFLS